MSLDSAEKASDVLFDCSKETGLSAPEAAMITALFPLGGVGAVYFGWLMDRYNANLVLAIGYLLTALAVYLVGKRRALCSSWRCSRRTL
jgi:sugar phosphate permease